jgi:hypothetical protein
MPRGKSIAHRVDRIVASSSNNNNGNHESLGVDQEEAFETQASAHDAASLRRSPFTAGFIHS